MPLIARVRRVIENCGRWPFVSAGDMTPCVVIHCAERNSSVRQNPRTTEADANAGPDRMDLDTH